MADSTNPQHPLVRDGRSQTERLDLKALAPESVALDDRSEHQLLVYLNEFAKSVAFYETDGSPEKTLQQSNWQPFFRSSSAVQVSLIEMFDASGYEARYGRVKQGFAEGLSRASYAPWFDFLFESALTVNSWFVALSNDVVLLENEVVLNESPLRRIIQDLIQSNLQPALAQLFGIANLFARPTPPAVGYQLPDVSVLGKEPVTGIWNLDTIRFQRDTTLAGLSPQDVERDRRIHDRLNDIFRTFAKTIRQIVAESARQDILQPTQTHEPHLALLYTFLRLLRPVLNDFNGLTQKHLDFYYRDVLKLRPKLLVPDAVHALFELPRPVGHYQLPKATRLKDGKDANKVDVLFALDDELIVSQTQIAELRTLFRNEAHFLAKPKANSVDGLGKDFSDPAEASWATLGNAEGEAATQARVGFGIASQTLVLSSGVRTITLTLTCANSDSNPIPAEAVNAFDVNLSGAKKWITKTDALTAISPDGTQLITTLTLGIKEEAIVAADPTVLGVDYGLTNEAVLQLIVKNKVGLYDALRSIQVKSVKLVTAVSQLQNVRIRTDEGDQDPTKPFMPFGPVPSAGSSFAIGSPEIFAKNLTSFTVSVDWDKLPADVKTYYQGYDLANPPAVPTGKDYFTRRVFFYKNGIPFNEKLNPGNAFDPLSLSSADIQNKPFTPSEIQGLPSVPVLKEASWQEGFLLIQLQKDFLHQYYTEALTRNALRLVNPPVQASVVGVTVQDIEAVEGKITNLPVAPLNPPPGDADQINQANDLKNRANAEIEVLKKLPDKKLTINPPYTPVIKNLTVGYTAEITVDDQSASEAKLFHIMPFDGGANYRAVQPNDTLLYDFNDTDAPLADTGALLIGLSNVVEGSLLPILFQVSESSAKTNLDPAIIKWSYLDGNEWRVLTAGQHLLNDATNGFIQSGIVQIVLPARTASPQTTVLPPSFYWLKAATDGDTRAICQAVGVHTQAARATFAPAIADDPAQQNDPARLVLPLAAGSVTRLDSPDVNIKAVKQPYPSFGGRPAESTSRFYGRVSEQLRHKGRGVTLFDYEQLVLEAFPELFKVKCIPHTFANRRIGSTNATINDVHAAPGHVTLVVVPDATKTQIGDRQKPMASRGLLTRIQDWLKPRISAFVKIQVLNPIYQEVDTAFRVQFYPGKSPEFYREQLLNDMAQFLAPWTFDPTAQVTFGGVIYRSSILGFIENRDYVSFVTDFVMKLNGVSQEEIQASAARVIFTNGTHAIDFFAPDTTRKSADRGIGFNWQLTA